MAKTRIRPRVECRICGRDSALTADEVVHVHSASGSRCPGSGRPPAGEPPCDSCGRSAGRVSYPADLYTDGPMASTYVCFDPEHQAEAALWVKQQTGQPGVFVPFGRAV